MSKYKLLKIFKKTKLRVTIHAYEMALIIIISATFSRRQRVSRRNATCGARYETTSTRIMDSEQSHVGWVIRGYKLSAPASYLEDSGEIALPSWSGWQMERKSLDLHFLVILALQAPCDGLLDEVLQMAVVFSGPIMRVY